MKRILPIIAALVCASCEGDSSKSGMDKGVSKRMSDAADEYISARFQESGDSLYCNYAGNEFYQIKGLGFEVRITPLPIEERGQTNKVGEISEHVKIGLKLDFRNNPVSRKRASALVPYPIAIDDTEWGEWSDWTPFRGFVEGESYDASSWLYFEGKATEEGIEISSTALKFDTITEELKSFMASDS